MQLFKSLLTLLLITTLAWAPGFITGLAFDSRTNLPVADVYISCVGDTPEKGQEYLMLEQAQMGATGCRLYYGTMSLNLEYGN